MKKILYLLLLMLPSLMMAQSRGAEKLRLPTTPRRYYTQKNYQRLLTLDRQMSSKRAFLEMSIRDLSFNGLPSTSRAKTFAKR
jgi:hypothetical protein